MQFLVDFPFVWELIEVVVYSLLACLIYKVTGLKTIFNFLEDKMKIKYRTNQTVVESEGQSFEKEKDVYRLNKATNELELTGEKVDVDALVNSSKETALSTVLDKYLPTEAVDEVQNAYDIMQDDLDSIGAVTKMADYYRAKFGLGADVPIGDVFKAVERKSVELKELIAKKQSEVETDEEE